MGIIQLGDLRKKAGISQKQLAEHLNISQSQVSRYETNPEEATQGLTQAWIAFCGKVETHEEESLIVTNHGRRAFEEAVAPLFAWNKFAPSTDGYIGLPDLKSMFSGFYIAARKPRIAVAGFFDTGKSTAINRLLGSNLLPTDYQPTTSLPCLLLHISEKPEWQVEPVLIFDNGFSINDDLTDQASVTKHKLYQGGYDAITEYAQHVERQQKKPVVELENPYLAVAYVDAPILEMISLVDLPGFEHNAADSEKAELASSFYDGLIYTSPLTGMLKSSEIDYLSSLLQRLRTLPLVNSAATPLNNFYLLGTHLHAIRPKPGDTSTQKEILDGILDACCDRTYRLKEDLFSELSEKWGTPVTAEVLRSRMFGFAVDKECADLVKPFFEDLKHLAGEVFPRVSLSALNDLIKHNAAPQEIVLSNKIAFLERSLSERAEAEQEVLEMRKKKAMAIPELELKSQHLHKIIDDMLRKSFDAVDANYDRIVTESNIEAIIRSKFKDKKEASEYLPGFIVTKLQSAINADVASISTTFNDELSSVLNYLNSEYLSSQTKARLGFDFKHAFLSALTGMSAAGALAGWAALVAAGSNLGGYILAAKITGWLAALGVSISGGTATVASTIALLGGPITIAIGIGALVAGIAYALFGDDWQTRMAKKTVDQFKKQNIREQFKESFKTYWDDTKKAMSRAFQGVMKDYDAYIEERQAILALEPEVVKEHIQAVRNVEGFLRTMPRLPNTL